MTVCVTSDEQIPHIDTNTDWIDAVQELEAKGEAFVLVTVLGTKGSTPREVGTKMVFNTESSCGTIGGGHLEYRAGKILSLIHI